MRFDDFRPCIYKTTDFGETWTSVVGNLPADKSLNVVIQDRKNPNLLFVGTEQGVYVSLNGGTSWLPFKNNMPWVKVTDLVIHPRENDLIVASYGRGLWITCIAPLQELNDSVLAQDVWLFDIKPATERVYGGIGNYRLLGDSHVFTPNEPDAVVINYLLKSKTADPVKITVTNPYGEVLAEITGKGEAGLNTAEWDMRARPRAHQPPQFGAMGGVLVDPGEYVVTLDAVGRKVKKRALIRYRQGWTVGPVPVIIRK